MEAKLQALKEKWASKPADENFSIMSGKELVYVGRYPEGVVLRLNDDEKQITFLTTAMAVELGRKLLGAPG